MSFKKYLKSSKNHIGQSSIEYIIIMVVILGLLTAWLTGLFPRMRDNLRSNFFDKAVERIIE